MSNSGTVVISGFARLPERIAGKNSSSFIAVEFEVGPVNWKVLDIYCTLLPFVEKDILYKACLKKRIDEGITQAIEQLDKRFFGATKRAIIAALEDAYKCYEKVAKEKVIN